MADPVLGNLEILRFAAATNFAVSQEEDVGLRELEDGQSGRDVEPEKLFFITAGGALASKHLQTSLREGVPLERLAALEDVYPQLERHAVDGRVYAWGARPGQAARRRSGSA